jgi:hypothetical protein
MFDLRIKISYLMDKQNQVGFFFFFFFFLYNNYTRMTNPAYPPNPTHTPSSFRNLYTNVFCPDIQVKQ